MKCLRSYFPNHLQNEEAPRWCLVRPQGGLGRRAMVWGWYRSSEKSSWLYVQAYPESNFSPSTASMQVYATVPCAINRLLAIPCFCLALLLSPHCSQDPARSSCEEQTEGSYPPWGNWSPISSCQAHKVPFDLPPFSCFPGVIAVLYSVKGACSTPELAVPHCLEHSSPHFLQISLKNQPFTNFPACSNLPTIP